MKRGIRINREFGSSELSLIPLLILCGTFLSVLLLPYITISNSLPKIRPEDFLVLPALLYVVKDQIKAYHIYAYLLLAICILILLSIKLNASQNHLNDFFELYKVFKLGVFFHFFLLFLPPQKVKSFLQIMLIPLLVFNLFHYFNWLSFNTIVMPPYSSEIQLSSFGLDSLGNPATKRTLGIMGNPNNNAILFLFFISFLFPKPGYKKQDWFFFLLSFLLFLSAQSRTGFIALVVILMIYLAVTKSNWQWKAILVSSMLLVAVLFFLVDAKYLSSLGSAAVLQTHSVRGRLEVWQMLWTMIKQHPLFGHGPQKDFFYSQNLYAESEYFLNTWRYGFIGLITFLLLIFFPLFSAIKQKRNIAVVLVFVSLLITCITNTPLQEPRILVLFAAVVALAFKADTGNEKIIADSSRLGSHV